MNENNEGNDLKSVSLENTDTIESLDNGPFASMPPLESQSLEVPQDVDLNMQQMNNIPPVPPLENTQYSNLNIEENNNEPINDIPRKKKKGLPKIIFIIIIILAILMVAFGIYTMLNLGNTKTNTNKVVPKEVHIEIGTDLNDISLDIDAWATLEGVDKNSCTLDTSLITDTSKLNQEYEFGVTCNNKTYKGKAIIVDTVAPKVKTTDVQAIINSQVSMIDFIDPTNCEDKTACIYEFKDYNKLLENLKTPGEYLVEIIVKDEAGNKTEVSAKLNVVQIDIYLVCNNNILKDKFPMYQGNFTGMVIHSKTFTFSSVDEYNNLKNSNPDNKQMLYEGMNGIPVFDDNNLTLTITQNTSLEELGKSFNETLPNTYSSLRDYYINKGYSCEMTFE